MDPIETIPCGTKVSIYGLNHGTQPAITAVCIRYASIVYEVTYFLNGEIKIVWLPRDMFAVDSEIKLQTVGFQLPVITENKDVDTAEPHIAWPKHLRFDFDIPKTESKDKQSEVSNDDSKLKQSHRNNKRESRILPYDQAKKLIAEKVPDQHRGSVKDVWKYLKSNPIHGLSKSHYAAYRIFKRKGTFVSYADLITRVESARKTKTIVKDFITREQLNERFKNEGLPEPKMFKLPKSQFELNELIDSVKRVREMKG